MARNFLVVEEEPVLAFVAYLINQVEARSTDTDISTQNLVGGALEQTGPIDHFIALGARLRDADATDFVIAFGACVNA